jgi:hypothetical protein
VSILSFYKLKKGKKMGCDIHLYIEKRNKYGKWEELKVPEELLPDDRHYWVFYFLAGIRGSDEMKFKPQFEDRHFPDDTSLPVEQDQENYLMCMYGYTHAYVDEILNAPWKEAELEEDYFYIFFKHVLRRLLSLEDRYRLKDRDIRVLIGFDS